jgi:hypothetical protein
MILCAVLHAAVHTVSIVHGKMHSDWFNGIELLQGRWQHDEKVGYRYPSGLEKTLLSGTYTVCPAGHGSFKYHFFIFCDNLFLTILFLNLIL